jgi:hypothetical protein
MDSLPFLTSLYAPNLLGALGETEHRPEHIDLAEGLAQASAHGGGGRDLAQQ